MAVAGVVTAAVLVAGCSSPASSPSVLPSAVSQEPSTVMSTPPAAIPDPARFAFANVQPTVTELSSDANGGVTVTDLTFTADGIQPTEAYLVAPESGPPGPAIIWFHWVEYGNPTSNRTEFLQEARGLAARGAVSLLVQGRLPWLEPPVSITHDVSAIEQEVRMLWNGLLLLDVRPEVDNTRLAVVGHDFGGMYGSVFFGAEHHLNALVVMAPTARWADWFHRYWEISDPEDEYRAALAGLDPVTWLPEADGRPILLQFASDDEYVPADVAAEISAAAGSTARTETYEDAGHELNEAARTDREVFLAEHLALPSAD
jgi:dienelactone hydrolase